MASGKFGDIIGKAKQTTQPDNQISGLPENKVSSPPEQSEPMVNLCVKVPKSLRQHWAAEAKRQDITMTQVITEALNQKFGKPDNQ
jgi:hypothetical protein